jgi:hypothetical protein
LYKLTNGGNQLVKSLLEEVMASDGGGSTVAAAAAAAAAALNTCPLLSSAPSKSPASSPATGNPFGTPSSPPAELTVNPLKLFFKMNWFYQKFIFTSILITCRRCGRHS